MEEQKVVKLAEDRRIFCGINLNDFKCRKLRLELLRELTSRPYLTVCIPFDGIVYQ